MLKFKRLVVVGICLAIAQVEGVAWADSSAARSRTKQLIIHLENPVQRQAQASGPARGTTSLSLPDGRQVRVLRSFSGNGLVVELPEEVSLEEANQIAAEMSSREGVMSVQPDKRFYPARTPNDPEYDPLPVDEPGQWHLFETIAGIRMPTAWDLSVGSAGVVVAVIDTGIIPHRDLNAGRILPGYDFFSDAVNDNDGEPGRDSDPTDPGDAVNAGDCGPGEPAEDSSWHGLTVTGVILAESDNNLDIAGVDFAASLLPIRVLGRCGGNLSDVADAIRWAAGYAVAGVPVNNATPADVINLSLSGDGPCSLAEQTAINAAVAAGSVVVVSAGNDDGTNVADISPANCDNVIVAGAIARNGSLASYANVGLAVDVTAPGGDGPNPESNILTLYNSGTTVAGPDELAFVSGTSFTSAQVSAVASLMISRNAALTPSVLEDVIKATTRPFPDNSCDQAQCGTGVLNATAALVAAQNPAAIVADQAPVAAVGGSYSGKTDELITFDGSGSFDPENDPLTYAWDFGDGSFGTGLAPGHSYGVAGTYRVLLTVNDGIKESAISSTTAIIDGGQKIANTGSGGCTLMTAHSGKPDVLLWLGLLVLLTGRLCVWPKLYRDVV
jgi:serine protease